MQIRILGCSGGACAGLRTTALLVDDGVLIDCGTGVGDLTLQEMARVRHVFLTHAHLDHVLFLPLLSDTALGLRDGPIIVHALEETIAALRQHMFNGALWPDYSRLPTPDAAWIRFQALRRDECVDMGCCRITALPARHSIPAVGYLIDSGHGSFAFSGDTTYCEEFWNKLNVVSNLKYLMVETTMRDEDAALAERSRHTTPELLARGMRQLTQDAQLLVTHIEPDKVDEVRAQVVTAIGPHPVHFLTRGETYFL